MENTASTPATTNEPATAAPVDATAEKAPEVKTPPEAKPADKASEAAKELNASRWAALTKKERAIREEREALKAEKARIAEQRKALERIESLKAEAKLNPLKVLDEYGLTYEQLTETVLNNGKPTPDAAVRSVKDELERFKAEQAAAAKAAQEAEAKRIEAARQAALDQWRTETTDFVKGAGDAYELINLHGEYDLVTAVIEEGYGKTGKIMSAKEAAEHVEKYLYERAEKALASKKFASRATPQPVNGDQKRVGDSAQPRTVTNELRPTTPAVNSAKSADDRYARAIAAMEKAMAANGTA